MTAEPTGLKVRHEPGDIEVSTIVQARPLMLTQEDMVLPRSPFRVHGRVEKEGTLNIVRIRHWRDVEQ